MSASTTTTTSHEVTPVVPPNARPSVVEASRTAHDHSTHGRAFAAATARHSTEDGRSQNNPRTDPSDPDVRLQPLSSTGRSQRLSTAGGRPVVPTNPSTSTKPNLLTQLVEKAGAIWTWITGVVMLALTAATYVVTKIQSTVSDGQQAQQDLLAAQAWRNNTEYFKYCQGEEGTGKPLTDTCKATLDHGLEPPPHSSLVGSLHSKRGASDEGLTDVDASTPSRAVKAQSKMAALLDRAGAVTTNMKTFLDTTLPTHLLSFRGVRRRFVSLFRGGRRLGTGRQTYGLPTIESSLSAISWK